MRCRRVRKWLSDDLGGSLPTNRKDRMEAHLGACPACRAYREGLARIQAAAFPAADRSREYWDGFERRLESKLAPAGPGRARVSAPGGPGRRWALAAAGFLAMAAVGTYFAVVRPDGGVEIAWNNYEDPVTRILLEAEADPEFGALVDREVASAIEEMTPIRENGPEFAIPLAEDPLFWEGLSDEELRYIAGELEKNDALGGLR